MRMIQYLFPATGTKIRAVSIQGQPWFVAKDLGDALGLKNSRHAVASLDDDDHMTIQPGFPVGSDDIRITNAGLQLVSEPGLYVMIYRSRKPVARHMRKWVTTVVFPGLRQFGFYGIRQVATLPEAQPQPDLFEDWQGEAETTSRNGGAA